MPLSQATIAALQYLSAKWGMSSEDIVEMLVLDRFSVSDAHENHRRREEAWSEYRKSNNIKKSDLSAKSAFMAGYNVG